MGLMTTKPDIAILIKDKAAIKAKRKTTPTLPSPDRNPLALTQQILDADLFLGMLCLERKRAERSSNKFILVLVEAEDLLKTSQKVEVTKRLVRAVNSARRETDLAGWYKQDAILGVIFTELGEFDETRTVKKVLQKVHQSLVSNLKQDDLRKVRVSAHVFAEDSEHQDPDVPANPTFYPDLFQKGDSKKFELKMKRAMDVVGSLLAVVLFGPLFIAIAAIIKLTSKGPILFSQERLGQFGETFTCLKFRSMYANNDPKIHQEFMKRVIRGDHDGNAGNGGKPVYKMTNDPRITKIGRLLRKTSLDELPQFFNVLRGTMSLVGPRPPLAYEFEEYDIWHRRRVLELKPGITGLWQVGGRSRVQFDDMVRLDLQYARGWSLWLDIQILLKTPGAVILGDGAY
jgi:exopolysaccharide biosynthesis polyprenyl glycosylphosphotransferase